MTLNKNIVPLFWVTIFLFFSCATYYQKSVDFHRDFASGNIEDARRFLENNSKAEEKKDRLLYFLDRGVVEQMLGNYQLSNEYLEKAYLYNQNYRNNFGNDVLEMVANPMLKPYKAEEFEAVMLYYYKAINYIHLGELDNALIEIRRINIQLNELNDRYEGKRNRYKQDAFALNLMGIIYEAKGEINDAFIAYRNSFEAYKKVYEEEFQLSAPEQLKSDLLRTSYQLGFRDEYNRYSQEFGKEYRPMDNASGELVVFWLNGLGPVKGEFSLNLTVLKGEGGMFTFANEAEGFNIPYSSAPGPSSGSANFSDLKVVRMAIPKFRKRTPIYNRAVLKKDSLKSVEVKLEKAEDIQAIAFASLEDRMLREVSKSVGRLAIKQAAEAATRQQNEDLGSLVSIFNGLTEKADTRNWQTLPNSIYYARIKLAPGNHELSLQTIAANNEKQNNLISVEIKEGRTSFYTLHSLASTVPHN